VHVVVHHGLGQLLYEPRLDLEALGRRDVLQVDAAEPRGDAHHRLHEGVHVFGVYEDRHRRDAGQLLVEDGLALHHRHRGYGSDVAQAQDARSVRADGNAAPDHGQLAREGRVLGDGLARPRHPRGVHVAHVLNRSDGLDGLDHELPALVLEQRPIARPQNLDALQGAQHIRDALGLVAVLHLDRHLAYGGLASDVDRHHVADEAVTFGYGSGDFGELPRTVRQLDAVGVIERHGEPPNVPERSSPS
jgi:hypothetical protein